MKKLLITIISTAFILTNISFVNAQNTNVNEFIDELDRIQNELTLITKTIADAKNKSNEEIEKIRRTIANNISAISYSFSKMNNLYKNEPNTAIRKQYSAISNALASYSFALETLSLYLDDLNDINQFLEAVDALKSGNDILEDIKKYAR